MNENNSDLIIIGDTIAFAAAIKANELKAETLILNNGLPLGGTCVKLTVYIQKHYFGREKLYTLLCLQN